MNLDEYFSKYVDAELSASEDAEMRAFLADNEVARSEFEQAALISVAMMRESESITTPDDLFQATDALIISKIEENEKKRLAALAPVRRRQGALSMALILCIVILGDSVRLGDRDFSTPVLFPTTHTQSSVLQAGQPQESFLTRGGAERHAGLKQLPGVQQTLAAATQKSDVNGQSGVSSLVSQIPASDNTSVALSANTAASLDQSLAQSEARSFHEALAAAAGLRSLLHPSAHADPASSSGIAAVAMVAPDAVEHPREEKDNVQLSTFVGSIIQTSATTASTQHYSQSIGYPVSEGVNMGFEVGTFALMASVPQQYGTSTSSIEELKPKGTLSSVENASLVSGGSSNGPNFGDQNAGLSAQRNVVWGAAYVERSIISSSDLSIKARVAVGTSDGGALVFARALSAYRVYGPVSLTLGSEGRMYIYDDKNTGNTDQTLQTMMSLMYGVQIKF